MSYALLLTLFLRSRNLLKIHKYPAVAPAKRPSASGDERRDQTHCHGHEKANGGVPRVRNAVEVEVVGVTDFCKRQDADSATN